MTLSVTVGSTNLTGSGVDLESYDWGAPRLKAEAAAHDSAGRDPNAFPGDRHEDADFTLTAICTGTTASATDASIASLLTSLVANASLTVTEHGSSNTRYTYLRSVAEPALDRHHGRWCRVTVKGTRCPYWHSDAVQVAENALTNGYGTVDVADVTGDVTALTRYYMTGQASATACIVAVRETDAGFTWVTDCIGTAVESYIGGSGQRTTLTNSATWYQCASATVTASAYAGRYLVAVRNVHGTGTIKTRVRVITGTASATAVHSICDQASGVAGTVLVGPLTLPATDWLRNFPSTSIVVESSSSGSAGTAYDADAFWLIPAPSATDAAAAIVVADMDACVDGAPLYAPGVYAYDRATDKVGESTLSLATPYGWPMLRPGDNTLYVLTASPTLGTGYVSATYIPRYLTSA